MYARRCGTDQPRSARSARRPEPTARALQARCASACVCGLAPCAKPAPGARPAALEDAKGPAAHHSCYRRIVTMCITSMCGVAVVFFFFHGFFCRPESAKVADALGQQGFDPCCAFPCMHNGICTSRRARFECDCTGTGYHGAVCEKPSWRRWVLLKVVPSMDAMQQLPGNYPWFWGVVNFVPFLHRHFIRFAYLIRAYRVPTPPSLSATTDYVTLDSYYNRSLYARYLQPVPQNCPTQMGIYGPKKLPPVEEVFERILKRRHFIPCNRGTNLYFTTYAQFFTHQFFKTNYTRGPGITFGTNEGVDTSNIYGQTEDRRRALRSFEGGKLKTSIVDGEDVVPKLSEVPDYFMAYPAGKTLDDVMQGGLHRQDRDVEPKWAMGHGIFSLTPMLFVVATLWLREHNRVCDVLKAEHPDWDDERLYQTARLIVTGEMVKMTLTEYVQHLSQYKLRLSHEPEVLHGSDFQFQNRILVEFVHLYHWHNQMPDIVRVEDEIFKTSDMLFSNNSEVFDVGFNRFLSAMFVNIAGSLTVRNHPDLLAFVGKSVLQQGRDLRLQSFNNYRRAFGLSPYKSFVELTNDPEIANDLRQIYGEVEAVEFYVGLMAEKHTYSVTSPTMVVMGGSWAVKGLVANPLGAPAWWKPSTFGGRKGWDIVRRANLRDFVCRNMRGSGCSKMHVAYSVPAKVLEAALRQHAMMAKAPVLRDACPAAQEPAA